VKKWLWIGLLVIVPTLILVGCGLIGLYAATQHVPAAYRLALEADRAEQNTSSDEMLEKTADLASDVEREGQWSAIFTADQINGWLAVDLVNNHQEMLPPDIRNPRVDITPSQMTVFCQYDGGRLSSILSLSVDAYLSEPNVIAIRIRKARAGALPLPLKQVTDQVTEAVHRANLRIRWRQKDGDPVALVTIPPASDREKQTRLEDLRLGDGELYLAGSTHQG
jgi:hypothetical protein